MTRVVIISHEYRLRTFMSDESSDVSCLSLSVAMVALLEAYCCHEGKITSFERNIYYIYCFYRSSIGF